MSTQEIREPGRVYLGCDPGKSGGLVLIDARSDQVLAWHRFARIGTRMHERIDGRLVHDWLLEHLGVWMPQAALRQRVRFCMEHVGSMPTDSARAAWAFGRARGAIEGIVEAFGFSMVSMRPTEWQRIMLRGKATNTKPLRKEAARQVASDRYPRLSGPLRLKTNDGVADAACIAAAVMLLDNATLAEGGAA